MPIQEWSENTLIAQFSDEPLFSEDFESLMRRLDAADSVPDVVVNLQEVSAINSSNLAQLLKLRKKLEEANGRLRICSARDTIWSVFLVTGLDKLFEFTDDVATSLTSLQLEAR
ncbi:MAG: STAS domain-containing protein [Planctomycetota bacterium]|jgi:anti-anti-sigma factor